MNAIALFSLDHGIARIYNHVIVMGKPMPKFFAAAEAQSSGLGMRLASGFQRWRADGGSSDDSGFLDDPSLIGATRAKRGSEPLAVAKALGIAIGLTVLYVMLREYGIPVA